jgi:hypothetical protein
MGYDEAPQTHVTGVTRKNGSACRMSRETLRGDKTMKAKLFGYWATTGILAFGLFAGGTAYLIRPPAIVEGMAHLGFPLYITTILGFWKLLGAVVLLAPRLPRLKEWAYAGAFFNMTGAVASHIFAGDGVNKFLWPLLFAVCSVASWALRPQSRLLGKIVPASTRTADRTGFVERHGNATV